MNDRLTLRRKLLLVVMLTTGMALLLSAVALLTYELRAYRSASVEDLSTQAELIAGWSAPALVFDDAAAARSNLAALLQRPNIRSAAIYRANGQLFVTHRSADPGPAPVPAVAQPTGHRFDGDDLEVFHTIELGAQAVGTAYLRGHYNLDARLQDYALILILIMLSSLGLAALVFQHLQRAVTEPLAQVADVAREVVEQRNYSLRVPKTSSDEIGVLVDAFNAMLAEVGRRTAALERSNEDLSQEMSERHKAEALLRTADRRKDEFLATLAHELRNPLAPLANGLEILKRGDADAGLQQRARLIMERQLKQMVRLIDDLLELSRMSTGKLELRRAPVDLVALLGSAVESTEPLMRGRGHRLAAHLPHEPVWLDADAMRLTQVFVNLLTNAAKYTDADGLVTVELVVEGGQALVHVSDNGIGVAPGMQERIFEMFAQVDQSLERGRAGLGVGLTLARQLVELHGGTIALASAGLGQGSRFSVALPLAEQPPAEPPTPAPATARRGSDGSAEAAPLQVLVADDNADFASSLACMLQAHGHQVQVVFDGLTALEAATAQRPDIGFFDIGMPGLNGYELAQRLRLQPCMQGVTLVAVTGWGQESDRLRARQAGFDHHLVKPVDLDQVLHLLPERAAL